MKARARFELLTYWHAGTGRGDGERADAVVQRTADGLPFLPGRTVKGLLRHAVELGRRVGMGIQHEDVVRWFGSAIEGPSDTEDRVDRLEAARFSTREGVLRVGSAELGADWAAWARSVGSAARSVARAHGDDPALAQVPELAPLFATLASTSISETGVAAERTLRTLEVAVPMALVAELEGPDGDGWLAALQRVSPFLRALGSGRNRGLGRVALTLEEAR